eukprot:g1795.t1
MKTRSSRRSSKRRRDESGEKIDDKVKVIKSKRKRCRVQKKQVKMEEPAARLNVKVEVENDDGSTPVPSATSGQISILTPSPRVCSSLSPRMNFDGAFQSPRHANEKAVPIGSKYQVDKNMIPRAGSFQVNHETEVSSLYIEVWQPSACSLSDKVLENTIEDVTAALYRNDLYWKDMVVQVKDVNNDWCWARVRGRSKDVEGKNRNGSGRKSTRLIRLPRVDIIYIPSCEDEDGVSLDRIRGCEPPQDDLLNFIKRCNYDVSHALEEEEVSRLAQRLSSRRWSPSEERSYVKAARRPRNFRAITERIGPRVGRDNTVAHYYWRAALSANVRRHLSRELKFYERQKSGTSVFAPRMRHWEGKRGGEYEPDTGATVSHVDLDENDYSNVPEKLLQERSWTCATCTYINQQIAGSEGNVCAVCGFQRKGSLEDYNKLYKKESALANELRTKRRRRNREIARQKALVSVGNGKQNVRSKSIEREEEKGKSKSYDSIAAAVLVSSDTSESESEEEKRRETESMDHGRDNAVLFLLRVRRHFASQEDHPGYFAFVRQLLRFENGLQRMGPTVKEMESLLQDNVKLTKHLHQLLEGEASI